LNAVLAAFPRRSLVLKPGRGALGGWLLGLLGLVLFGGFLTLLAVEVVPEIRDDFAVRETARPAPGARIVEGRCRSRLFLLQSCDITVAWRGKDGGGTRKLRYLFVEPHMGSWNAQPMADPQRPELATTDLGLERLWNRVGTAIGGGVLAVALIVGLLIGARRVQSARGQVKALSGRVLEPVPVRFRGWGQGPSWIVQDDRGATAEWPVRKSDRPFVLDEARGLVLALRDPAGGVTFPLDANLRFVALSAEERARILAARAGAAR
jgi:hypothetical protein